MKDMSPEEQEFLNQPWMQESELPGLSGEVKGRIDRELFGRGSSRGWIMAAAAVFALMLLGYWLLAPAGDHPGKVADQGPQRAVDPVVKRPLDSVSVVEVPKAPAVIEAARRPLKHQTHYTINTSVPAPAVGLSLAVADHPGILETCPEIF